VYQLQGGHYLTLQLNNPLTPVVRRYWELRTDQEVQLSAGEAIEEFRERFKTAVKLRLRSDVPVGVCLSGGLDSSSILCQATKLAPEIQFQTFSACFEDKAIDEGDFVSAVVKATRSIGHPTFPDGRLLWENIRRIAFHHDEPLGSGSTFSQWSIMELARKHGVPVVLGGQGADEILCGYQKYRYFYFWHLLRKGHPRLLHEILMWPRNGTRSYVKWNDIARYLPSGFQSSPTKRLCPPEFRDQFSRATSGLTAGKTMAERQKLDLTYLGIPGMLRHEERNAMAHSVESRLPFLDYQLVEFAVNCPPSFKVRNGWSKWMLRDAMKGTLPEQIRLRKTKRGFDAPVAQWTRLGLQNGHRELWDTPRLHMDRFLDGPSLAHECNKFLDGASSSLPPSTIFRAISLELWARVHRVS
jgi:asparagine synthase (glutamine-hydrolysing)